MTFDGRVDVAGDLGRMRVQAMLCRYAELNDHGLTIVGAGVNQVVLPPGPEPRVDLALAVLVFVPWTETNQEHKFQIELVHEDPGGGSRRVPINIGPQHWLAEDDPERGKIHWSIKVGRPAELPQGAESVRPYAIPIVRPLAGPGSYYFSFQLNGDEVERVSFQAITVQIVGLAVQ